MDTKNLTIALVGVFLCAPAILPSYSYAGDDKTLTEQNSLQAEDNKPFFTGRYNWQDEQQERLNFNLSDSVSANDKAISDEASATENVRKAKYKSALTDEGDLKDKILGQIPYGHKFKYIWNVADGDVDLYVANLRADRRNRGLKYETNYVPMIGEVDGLNLKFKAGMKKTEFSFEHKRVPFVGDIEGFSLKGSTGNKGSKIYAKYIIPLD